MKLRIRKPYTGPSSSTLKRWKTNKKIVVTFMGHNVKIGVIELIRCKSCGVLTEDKKSKKCEYCVL